MSIKELYLPKKMGLQQGLIKWFIRTSLQTKHCGLVSAFFDHTKGKPILKVLFMGCDLRFLQIFCLPELVLATDEEDSPNHLSILTHKQY